MIDNILYAENEDVLIPQFVMRVQGTSPDTKKYLDASYDGITWFNVDVDRPGDGYTVADSVFRFEAMDKWIASSNSYFKSSVTLKSYQNISPTTLMPIAIAQLVPSDYSSSQGKMSMCVFSSSDSLIRTATSTNSSTWTLGTGGSYVYRRIIWDSTWSHWLAVRHNSSTPAICKLVYSTDGLTWTACTGFLAADYITDVVMTPSGPIAWGYNSTNITKWSTFNGIAWNKDLTIASSGGYKYIYDTYWDSTTSKFVGMIRTDAGVYQGRFWSGTTTVDVSTKEFYRLVYSSHLDMYMAVSGLTPDGYEWTTNAGSTWTKQTSTIAGRSLVSAQLLWGRDI